MHTGEDGSTYLPGNGRRISWDDISHLFVRIYFFHSILCFIYLFQGPSSDRRTSSEASQVSQGRSSNEDRCEPLLAGWRIHYSASYETVNTHELDHVTPNSQSLASIIFLPHTIPLTLRLIDPDVVMTPPSVNLTLVVPGLLKHLRRQCITSLDPNVIDIYIY